MPVVQEEGLLTDTEEAGDKRKQGQSVFVLGAHVQSLTVQHLNKVFQAWNIHFILDGGSYWDEDFNEKSSHCMLDVLLLS
jgi:hypothetical protein